MKKILLGTILCAVYITCSGQEKKLGAASIINQKAPELVVEEWISETPNTEGKFVLIEFWATRCSYCRKTILPLNYYQNIFQDDLVVIGISSEPAEKVRKFLKPKIKYYSAVDSRRRMFAKIKGKRIPHCLLIDPYGIVRWEGHPLREGHELTTDIIRDIISKYK